MIEIEPLDLDIVDDIEIELPKENTQFDEYAEITPRHSLYMNRGGRRQMLDRFFVQHTPTSSTYSVFDGHGESSFSSEFVAQNLHKHIQHMSCSSAESLKQAFLKTEQELHHFSLGMAESGTTALWVEVTQKNLTVASLGDSQVLVVRKGQHQVVSYQHTPANPQERKRIEEAGGWVLKVGDIPRTQGKLAVSRAFGNPSLRKYLSAEPEVNTYTRSQDDIALVIATDGLWSLLQPDEIARFVEQNLQDGENISQRLYELARAKNYVGDNVTIIVVGLQ